MINPKSRNFTAELYDEERPAVSSYPYGISKLQGEQAVMQLADDNFSDEFGVDFGAAELDTFAPTPNAAAPDGTNRSV